MVAMLLITRDSTSGTVKGDPYRPDALYVDYTINKFDRNALLQALLITADMLYIEGAKRILSPQSWVPIFESNVPKTKEVLMTRIMLNGGKSCWYSI